MVSENEAENATAAEEQALRKEVAEELEAEESGEVKHPVVDASKNEGDNNQGNKIAESDPWAGVNPAVKAMFTELSAQVKSIGNITVPRLEQAERRIGAITNEFNAAKQAAAVVANAPTKEQMAEAAESDEKWNELKSDFPEWAEATDIRMDSKIERLRRELIGKVGGSADRSAEVESIKTKLKDTAKPGDIQRALVDFFHPGWAKDVKSNEYTEWLRNQPDEIIKKTKSLQAVDAVTVLDSFNEFKGSHKTAEEIAVARRRRLGMAVNPVGGRAIPAKSEADMNAAELRSQVGKEIFAE